MKIKQKEYTGQKKKYSEIQHKVPNFAIPSKNVQVRAKDTVRLLLDNGYAIMNGYTINEVLKTMRVLKELSIEYTIDVIITTNGLEQTYYEFTTPMFEDDRFTKEEDASDVMEIIKDIREEIVKNQRKDRIFISNKKIDTFYVDANSVNFGDGKITFELDKLKSHKLNNNKE